LSFSELAIVRGSIRNKGLHPTTEVAQQISRITQDQLPPKIGNFHQARLRGVHFDGMAQLAEAQQKPMPTYLHLLPSLPRARQ
jgi:hypothetical protein